ncbi:MAG: hypothetical protein K0Q87_453 [Neobacillus sp.]|jgi:hypothetical protein|nr:hypothetical protein [Neobacillus sp.]
MAKNDTDNKDMEVFERPGENVQQNTVKPRMGDPLPENERKECRKEEGASASEPLSGRAYQVNENSRESK